MNAAITSVYDIQTLLSWDFEAFGYDQTETLFEQNKDPYDSSSMHTCHLEFTLNLCLWNTLLEKHLWPQGGAVAPHDLHHFLHCIRHQTDLFNDLFINSASFTKVLLMYAQCLHRLNLTTFSASAVLSSNLALFH